jgi:hypothetical protein
MGMMLPGVDRHVLQKEYLRKAGNNVLWYQTTDDGIQLHGIVFLPDCFGFIRSGTGSEK